MSLIMGKCLAPAMRQTIRVLVPVLKFDEFFRKHFRETDEVLVHDPNEQCKAGDWVLIRLLSQKISLQVSHKLEKIVYTAGNIIDPISGQKSVGYELESDVHRQAKLFGLKPFDQR